MQKTAEHSGHQAYVEVWCGSDEADIFDENPLSKINYLLKSLILSNDVLESLSDKLVYYKSFSPLLEESIDNIYTYLLFFFEHSDKTFKRICYFLSYYCPCQTAMEEFNLRFDALR
ncbi:hypothetical protein RF11_09779 [Thelohanellus kitauei]|uniref:Uncharacterized protein n=1 Tax=Thelohanellus kitauei TaxID=669202 RepID=A0A0C2IVF0_THEKT|nr:hypothetical protein RF11_09779 [Thelohanellus kitauei]